MHHGARSAPYTSLHGVVVIIATAETDKTIRIISMRKADKNEQKIYCENR
jgi:uncharacterized DUF497 family protein